MSDAAPTTPGRYDLLERIAVGGMAEVFLAKAHGLHGFEKTLAIKGILLELAQNREFEDQFITEAKLAVRLTHANLVQVFDFGRFGDTLFIAMEYVDGLDLAALLDGFRKQGRRLPLPAAFQIAIELARGLDFAHSRGVIHRDVSPSNILLSVAGEVKVADFGIAMTDAHKLVRSRHRHRIMGKWRYMSPEQTRGEDLETRSDLFSAAAVMYELFIGDKLFPGAEVDEIVDHIHRMEIPSMADERPGLPPRLDQVLRGALARDSRDRPARAADLQRALTEISYESSIVATPQDVAEVVVQMSSARRQPRAAARSIELAIELPGARPDDAGPARRSLDGLILQQLAPRDPSEDENGRRTARLDDAVQARPRTERSTEPDGPLPGPPPEDTSGERPADPSGEVAAGHLQPDPDARPATMVRTGVGDDGVTVWTLRDRPRQRSRITRRGTLVALCGVAACAALGWLAWSSYQGDTARLPRPALGTDAAAQVATDADRPGILVIDSTPPGASVNLDGDPLPGVTPLTTQVAPGEEYRVEVSMTGYRSQVRDPVAVAAGETVPLSIALESRSVALDIRTQPPGAQVRLAGEVLGTTPLSRGDLPPGEGRPLVITKPGYQTESLVVDLVAGKAHTIDKTLNRVVARVKPSPRSGYLDLNIEDSWAEVYKGAHKIGRAPVKGLELPAGRNRLRLYNPASDKERTIVVEIVPGVSKYLSVRL